MCKEIVMIRPIIVTTLVITMAVISGCAYIPTPEHSPGKGIVYVDGTVLSVSAIPKEAIKLLKPGKTTRAEVLLKFGDPTQRFQQDLFFVYSWERTSGYFLWSFGMGTGGSSPVFKTHSLCLEFTQDNLLRRFEHLEAGLFKNMDELMLEWMEDKSVLPKNSKP
jgi:outer membrane protein assembly factor BamE (lipoprotein component of BamABCDE complex)